MTYNINPLQLRARFLENQQALPLSNSSGKAMTRLAIEGLFDPRSHDPQKGFLACRRWEEVSLWQKLFQYTQLEVVVCNQEGVWKSICVGVNTASASKRLGISLWAALTDLHQEIVKKMFAGHSSLPPHELTALRSAAETYISTWRKSPEPIHYLHKNVPGYARSLLYIRKSPGNKEGVYLIRDDESSDRIITIGERTLVDVIDLADPSKRLLLSIMEKGALTRHEQEMLSLRWKLHGVVHPTHSFTSGQNQMALYPLEARSSLLLPRMLWTEEQEMEDLISSMRELHKDEILLRAPDSVSLKDEYGLTRRAFLDASLATTIPQRKKDPDLHDKLGCGNRYYWAPEVMGRVRKPVPKPVPNQTLSDVPPPTQKMDSYTMASDIWILGLVLWERLSKDPASAMGKSYKKMVNQGIHPTEWIKTLEEPEDKFTLDHMIFKMLRPEPTERLTIFEVEKCFCSYIALKMIASVPYLKKVGEKDHEKGFRSQWTEAVKSSDPTKLQKAIAQVRSIQATPSEGWSPLALALSLIHFYS